MAEEKLDAVIREIARHRDVLNIDGDQYKDLEGDELKARVRRNESSLQELSQYLGSLRTILDQLQDRKKAVLKAELPGLLILAVAHHGKHYWTSASSRRKANVLLSTILRVCGCSSVAELLIGELQSGPTHSSPYLPLAEIEETLGGGIETHEEEEKVEKRVKEVEVEEEKKEKEEDDEEDKEEEEQKDGDKNKKAMEDERMTTDGSVSASCEDSRMVQPALNGTTADDSLDRNRQCTSEGAHTITARILNKAQSDTSTSDETTQQTNDKPEAHPQEKPIHDLRNDEHSQLAVPGSPVAMETSVSTAASNIVCQERNLAQEAETVRVFQSGLLKPILSVLRTKLNKETWKRHPPAKHTLLWCLRHLKHPHVSPHLDSFLPPLLMLLDDHECYHKVLGLSGVTHLIRNVDATELRWHGRSEVIYKAIFNFLYNDEVELIHALHPCMLRLLPVIEGPPPRTIQGPRKPTRADEVFTVVLDSLDRESKIASRKAYLAHVGGYIDLLGIYIVRHLKRLQPVLFSCLEFPDYTGEETRQITLRTLALLMKHAWPRIPHHKDEILKTLLKLVSDLCPSKEEIPDKPDVEVQLPLVTECLVVLARCCELAAATYRSLLGSCGHKGLELCLTNALELLK